MDEFPEPHMAPRPDYACMVYYTAGCPLDLAHTELRYVPAVLCAWALTKLTGRDVRFWCRDRDKGFAVFRLEPRR